MIEFLEALNLIALLIGGIGLLLLGLIVGRARELAHIRDLTTREKHFEQRGIMITDLRTLPPGWEADGGRFVGGQAVIASDQFKRFLGKWQNFLGGKVRTYERIMDRARREAKLRLMEQAERENCNVIWCYRQETSTIGGGPTLRGMVMAEVFVYGTAYRVAGAD